MLTAANAVSSTTSGRATSREGRGFRCAVLVERRYLSQAQPIGLIAGLRQQGHEAVIIDPEADALEAGDDGWLREIDLAVARGRSWPVLTMLGWAESRGIPTVNARRAVASVHNKADMALRLEAAGLPVPFTCFGSIAKLANRFTARDYPIILKPVFGDNSNGLRVVHTKEELLSITWPDPVALAQCFVANPGFDLKLYAIGDDVWAVRKPGPFTRDTSHVGPELLPMTPLWRDLALRCGRLFGLDLFGVDCVETSEGPVVIEVNEFPNYSGIPSANETLAAYVLSRARQERAA